jgi:hydrogenase 3 maturation protease
MNPEEPRNENKKIVVMGVGNRMRGDDAIGCLVIDELTNENGLTVIDCDSTPENYIDKVISLKPERVIIIDACNFKSEPGKFRLFSEKQIDKISQNLISTHNLPLNLTVTMIKKQLPCEILLLGVQPEQINFGEGLSPKLEKAKQKIVKYLKDLIKINERRKG